MGIRKLETVVHAFKYWAEKTPDKICLIEAETDRQCTFSELWKWGAAFSRKLTDAGVKSGDRIVVRVGGLLETYTALFGVLLAGGVYCPVEKSLKPLAMKEMFDYYDCEIYVSTEMVDCDAVWLDLNDAIDGKAPLAFDVPMPSPDMLATIIFSTGTTGKAKGVVYDHEKFFLACEKYREAYFYNPNSIFLWIQSLDRPTSIFMIFGAWNGGLTSLHVYGIPFVNELKRAIDKHKPTVAYLQSFAINILLSILGESAFKEALGNLELIFINGGALAIEQRKIIRRLLNKTTLWIHYSCTECQFISNKLLEEPIEANNCGKPLDWVTVFIKDSDGNIIRDSSPDKFGNVVVESDSMFNRYWKADELTNKVKQGNQLTVTDAAYINEYDELFILGRSDDVIVSGGYKIAPYEIENIASSYDGVEESVCVGVSDKLLSQVPFLYVKMRNGKEFNVKDIHSFLSQRLESFKIPSKIIETDDFPRVGNTIKIDRKALKNYD